MARPGGELKPVFGYCIATTNRWYAVEREYLASMPYTDRSFSFCSLTNNWAYALTWKTRRACNRPSAPNTFASVARRVDPPRQSSCVRLLLWTWGARHADECTRSASVKRFSIFSNRLRRAHDVQLHALRSAAASTVPGGAGWKSARKVVADYPRFSTSSKTPETRTNSDGRTQKSASLSRFGGSSQRHRAPCSRAAASITNSQGGQVRAFYDRFQFRRAVGDHGDVLTIATWCACSRCANH
jgi:hypothetical protein